MTTTTEVELFIITVVLSVYFIAMTVLVVFLIKFVVQARVIAAKAEAAIDSIESAAENLKHLSKASKSHFPLLAVLKKMYDMSVKGKAE
ncbi:MAG TPA: hypothetical protein VIH90_06985 [Candidatus Saccharimonadales bacterium]